MPTALVTGASRGLGLEFSRQLVTAGWRVLATCRDPDHAQRLHALAAERAVLDIAALDVTDPPSAAACADRLAADGVRLDLLVNNAGVWDVRGPASSGPLADLDPVAVCEVLRTNALGALVVVQALAPRLADGARVVNLSSGLGSLAREVPRRNYGYALSKAALNMLTRYLADELGARGLTVVALDPGWVRTDLGGDRAPLSAEESVAGLCRVIADLRPEMNGTWLNRHGETIQW